MHGCRSGCGRVALREMDRAIVNDTYASIGVELFHLNGSGSKRQYLASASIYLLLNRAEEGSPVIIRPPVWRVEKFQLLDMRSIGVEPICKVDKQAIAFIDSKDDGARPLVTSELNVSGCQPVRGDYWNHVTFEGEHHASGVE